MNNSKLTNFLLHLLIFIIIEIIFVLVIFRERPSTDLYTMTGLAHLSYWIILVIAGWFRETLTAVWSKFLATYLPVIYHLGIHLRLSRQIVETVTDGHESGHDEHDIVWTIISACALGLMIRAGEYRLHRTRHCDAHHASAHQHCHDPECEENHTSPHQP